MRLRGFYANWAGLKLKLSLSSSRDANAPLFYLLVSRVLLVVCVKAHQFDLQSLHSILQR